MGRRSATSRSSTRASTTPRPPRMATGTATVEQSNANKAAERPGHMVYIGTYNSGAAKLSIPILNAACLVMFSPANSYPGLTKAVEGVTKPGEPDSYYPNGYRNYARDINTDDVQGWPSSEWALSLGTIKAYVLDDGQIYGQGIGRAWAQNFGKIGGTVLSPNGASESYDPKATDYQTLAEKIKASGADIVFVGAITGQGTPKLWKDIVRRDPGHQDVGPRRREREDLVSTAPAPPRKARTSPSVASASPATRHGQGLGRERTRPPTTTTRPRSTPRTATRRRSRPGRPREGRDQRSLATSCRRSWERPISTP